MNVKIQFLVFRSFPFLEYGSTWFKMLHASMLTRLVGAQQHLPPAPRCPPPMRSCRVVFFSQKIVINQALNQVLNHDPCIIHFFIY